MLGRASRNGGIACAGALERGGPRPKVRLALERGGRHQRGCSAVLLWRAVGATRGVVF
jgi:hypothetical protein